MFSSEIEQRSIATFGSLSLQRKGPKNFSRLLFVFWFLYYDIEFVLLGALCVLSCSFGTI